MCVCVSIQFLFILRKISHFLGLILRESNVRNLELESG